ncbi:DGQHR domain-containing protein [Pelagicoccus sp. SDUM812005]|uniref:DGQHR domain-containing protein n=1 Tax=Pelagicoccus sp. SDUM812005 TaxID=3041257 RepID=UPI00280EFDB1|nr:DGQHR domain-containing protein [Pelagicoccus sp. SDUM812005]MDQ8182443.1 DGQHR domain-containing protein [Pelagicoccus sp. SDUM812005]
MRKTKLKYFETKFEKTPTYTFSLKVSQLLKISYVSVRGVDKEEGAVQRVLSARRIADIKNYILDGNLFFNSFILNWNNKDITPNIYSDHIELPLIDSSAQVIDGQHRLAGLEAAVEENTKIGDTSVIVTLCLNLTTKEAAKIFLNINTEQKPVPKSLIYDLFGEVVNDEEHAINRSTDIARQLNEDPNSPFYRLIKFPGSPRGVGVIELSTFVSSIKDDLLPNGAFSKVKIRELSLQKQALENFFLAIKNSYEKKDLWDTKSKNPFLRAAGFNGAIDFFMSTLIMKCAERKSFKTETIIEIIALDSNNLLSVEDIKGLDGKTARTKIKSALEQSMYKSLPSDNGYSF